MKIKIILEQKAKKILNNPIGHGNFQNISYHKKKQYILFYIILFFLHQHTGP